MMQHIQDSDSSGEQVGSLRPRRLTPFLFTLSLLVIIPFHAFAATQYLEDNADDFISKTQSTYGDMINVAALLHDYDPKLITAVIVVESEGNEVAVSGKGAKGLMQLMPQTAKAMGAKNPNDPFQNILAGTKYLKELENGYGFDDHAQALVAYNMGPTRAKRWLSQYSASDYIYVKQVMYVYDVLAQNERAQQKIATTITHKIDAVDESSPRPMMTKPRNFSLAALPLTLPTNRKDEVVTAD